MGLLGAGLLALFATMDMDKLKEIWGKFKEAITAIYDVMMPIVKAIGKWLEEKVLPATFELVMAQLENLTQMFVDIKGHFDGWDQKSGSEKFWSVIDALGSLGTALGKSAYNIAQWIEKSIFGGDGSFTKGIKDKLLTLFGPVEKEGSILNSVSKMCDTVLSFFLPDEMAATWSTKIKTFLGGADDDADSNSIMGKIMGGLKAMLALFVVGALFPAGWVATALMAPMRAAMSLAMVGAKGLGGLASIVGKSLMAAGKGAVGAAKFGAQLLGKVGLKGAGILGLAFAVGKGIKDGYDAVQGGASIREGFDVGLASFFDTLTLGLLPDGMALTWAKNINDFFGGIYESIFGEKQKEMTQAEIEKRTGKRWAGLTQEQKNAEQKKLLEEKRVKELGGKGAAAAVKKGDVVGMEAEMQALTDKMDAAAQKKDWKAYGEAEKKFIKLRAKRNKAIDASSRDKELMKIILEGEKDIPVIGPQTGLMWDKSQTRASSLTGMDNNSQSKLAVMGNLFASKGWNSRLTSGFRDSDRGNKAMLNSADGMRKYKKKWRDMLTDEQLDSKPGSKERQSAIDTMRAGGFGSQHEHGNAIDFSYPVGYSKENFGELKTTLLGAFPGASIVGESDHVHMAFNKKNSGIQLAQLQADSGMINRAAAGSNTGNSTMIKTGDNNTISNSSYTTPKQTNDTFVTETARG